MVWTRIKDGALPNLKEKGKKRMAKAKVKDLGGQTGRETTDYIISRLVSVVSDLGTSIKYLDDTIANLGTDIEKALNRISESLDVRDVVKSLDNIEHTLRNKD